MKNLLAILPEITAKDWKVEAWCIRSDAPTELCKHTFFPSLKRFPSLELPLFSILVNCYAFWRRLTGSHGGMGLVHSTGAYHLGADVVSVHFMNPLWVRLQLRMGIRSMKEFGGFLISCFGTMLDLIMFTWPKQRLYLPVSDSLTEEVRKRQNPTCSTITVPSVYDPARFNPQIRAESRLPSRNELGYSGEDIILAFTSQGSYRRKGLLLGLEALQIVRTSNPKVKLLIIGGSAKVTAGLKRRIEGLVPEWEGWIKLAGHVPDIARALSAADAFFFPSFFESFASVELEAAALGLPLLLTRHFGTEMTLRPGINGELLSSEPREMAAQITAAIARLPEYDRSGGNRGLTVAQFSERILAAYETAATAR